jgi:SAM-dependent methyltransferase
MTDAAAKTVSPLKKTLAQVPFARSAHRTARGFARHIQYLSDFLRFQELTRGSKPRFALRWRDRLACLEDNTSSTTFDRHYIYHPAWAARVLARTKPSLHIDISSTVYFASLVSAFVPIRFLDYRPADLHLSGLNCDRADLLALPFENLSVASISCMHVVEHVGLGRYGDPLDPEGDIKAARELQRVLAPGGSLVFVVPVGLPVIRFNGHRIYSYDQVVDFFPDLKLQEFTLIPESAEDGPPILGASKERVSEEQYGCGCFWFRRC